MDIPLPPELVGVNTHKEGDPTDRSKKKGREGEGSYHGNSSMPTPYTDLYEEEDGRVTKSHKRSYANSVLGRDDEGQGGGLYEEEEDLWRIEEQRRGAYYGVEEDDPRPGFQVIERKHGDYECPEFVLNKKEQRRICEPWRNGVIVKILGRKIGYKALENRLKQMWGCPQNLSRNIVPEGVEIPDSVSSGDKETPKEIPRTEPGPWTVVQKTRRGKKKEAREKGGREEEAREEEGPSKATKGTAQAPSKAATAGGSRFTALQNQEEDDVEDQQHAEEVQPVEKDVSDKRGQATGRKQNGRQGQGQNDNGGAQKMEAKENRKEKGKGSEEITAERYAQGTRSGKGGRSRVDVTGFEDVTSGAQATLGKSIEKDYTQEDKRSKESCNTNRVTQVQVLISNDMGPTGPMGGGPSTYQPTKGPHGSFVDTETKPPDPMIEEGDMIFEDCNAIDWATPSMQSSEDNPTNSSQLDENDMEFVPETLEAHLYDGAQMTID
ncbi:hypothetical protein RIF29_41150 [Crotalaria pallida]|uniref:Uncharacterized protein n=1 Tax=Crotalaria pallida TaxID=3830 RepID=A0AAN9HUZ5_CROPI